MFDVGKMGKTVIEEGLGLSISKISRPVGCSQSAGVSTYRHGGSQTINCQYRIARPISVAVSLHYYFAIREKMLWKPNAVVIGFSSRVPAEISIGWRLFLLECSIHQKNQTGLPYCTIQFFIETSHFQHVGCCSKVVVVVVISSSKGGFENGNKKAGEIYVKFVLEMADVHLQSTSGDSH